jgi:endoglucanase
LEASVTPKSSLFTFALCLSTLGLAPAVHSLDDSAKKAPAAATLSSKELVRRMGLGWNLGNTMEAIKDPKGTTVRDYETAWGNPETTREMIGRIKASGFSSVRIPVGWSNLMGAGYAIHPPLMARVQWIVDAVLAEGMVAVVNIHWDGGWWSKFPSDEAGSMRRYKAMWSQIAERFKDYPETLVFESLNEEGCFNDVWDRYKNAPGPQKQKAYGILQRINQAFTDLVRGSGGHNPQRHLLIAGYCTDIDLTVDPAFQMPTDPAGRGIVSVHYYTPFPFAGLTKDESWAKARRTWGTAADMAELDANLKKLKTRFLDKGVPVIMGEYGCEKRNKDPQSVRLYLLSVAEKAYRLGICPMLWDPGTHFDRRALRFEDAGLLEGFHKVAAMERLP